MGLRVFFFGLGYCAEALIRRARSIAPSGTARSDARVDALAAAGVDAHVFDGTRAGPGLEAALRRAEAIVVSIPPQVGDGPLDLFASAIAAAPNLARIVYFSTVGVYGEHGGRWVDETAATLTRSERSLARLADEERWTEAGRARGAAVDILRLPGIYGPGRNAIERLRAGEARRIVKPNHVMNRAHVDDIAEIARLVLEKGLPGQVWNVADDEPAPAAGRDRLRGGAARRSGPAGGAVRRDSAFPDGGELLRRDEARVERQGQGAARLRPGLPDLSRGVDGAVDSRGGARRGARNEKASLDGRLRASTGSNDGDQFSKLEPPAPRSSNCVLPPQGIE